METKQENEMMTQAAPPLTLARNWSESNNPTGWWMSEKLDGIRAYWNGEQLLSRNGNEFHAPGWFLAGLPSTPLDGELWMGRRSFQQTSSIVRRQAGADWNLINYFVFDMPALDKPFEQRLGALTACVKGIDSDLVQVLRQQRCRGLTHLHDELTHVESLGGEGLMLREPYSRYAVGRSASLLKVKTFHDAKAEIVDPGTCGSKYRNRLDSLVVRMDDGTEFAINPGFLDPEELGCPSIGRRVLFRYQGRFDSGIPRFASLIRLVP